MALASNESVSGGFVRDPAGRLVTVSASASSVLSGSEQLAGGFVRDLDGRLVTVVSAGGVLAGSEQVSGGFVRDGAGRLMVVSSGGVGWGGGFVRDQAGRLVTSVSGGGPLAPSEQFSGGFVRDGNGLLSLAGAAAVYTIGSTNPAGATAGVGTGITASSLWLNKRTLSGAAAGAHWTKLRGWISGGPGPGTAMRLAIYDDLSSSPNNLVGGGDLVVTAGSAAAEYTVTLPGTAPAPNGAYWVGFHFGTDPGGPAPYYAASGGSPQAYGNPSYASGLPAVYVATGTNGVNDIRVAADAS